MTSPVLKELHQLRLSEQKQKHKHHRHQPTSAQSLHSVSTGAVTKTSTSELSTPEQRTRQNGHGLSLAPLPNYKLSPYLHLVVFPLRTVPSFTADFPSYPPSLRSPPSSNMFRGSSAQTLQLEFLCSANPMCAGHQFSSVSNALRLVSILRALKVRVRSYVELMYSHGVEYPIRKECAFPFKNPRGYWFMFLGPWRSADLCPDPSQSPAWKERATRQSGQIDCLVADLERRYEEIQKDRNEEV